MKTLDQWLSAYGESHQNLMNRRIHKVAVPGIFLSIVGLVWSIPNLTIVDVSINWVWVVLLPVLAFYYSLSRVIFLWMTGFSLACVAVVFSLEKASFPVLNISIGLFIVLWVFQFIGHKVEGKKPSFFDDIQFLLIGPIWVFRQNRP
ncbi:Mpo1 family 2-hydroxy fatty acid dioxygenase [Vibrio algarum]|uniref:DUF962 domain-containing protein n=1 Tax=Vibrio algarum TaxID=3020714 RepID=A0ABT4YVZ7_9VIBR|nr:Mpo1-like protein [Vibrio sp. KJ40-1]MDB1125750.1 DUF962 domain-containing protein [Vibrio sp. KJ40-1]